MRVVIDVEVSLVVKEDRQAMMSVVGNKLCVEFMCGAMEGVDGTFRLFAVTVELMDSSCLLGTAWVLHEVPSGITDERIDNGPSGVDLMGLMEKA